MANDVDGRLIAGGAPGLHLYPVNHHGPGLTVLGGCDLLPNQGTTTGEEPA